MRITSLLCLVTAITLSAQTSVTTVPSGVTASVHGTVTDGQNLPISGASVTITRTFKTKETVTPYSRSVNTASDGSFLAQRLPAGSYSYCAQVPGDGYLNGCHWGMPMPSITVTAGQNLKTAIRVDKGSILKVRILDPGNVALQQSHDRKNPPILMGVWDAHGRFLTVHSTGRDAAGFNYQLTVPLDTPLSFHIVASKVTLADGAGTPLSALPASSQAVATAAASASQATFQHNSGDPNPKSFQFTITGVSK